MPYRLVLLNTEQTVNDPEQAQTTFLLEYHGIRHLETFCLHLDQGGHEPTPEEDSLAPFYQNPSRRILALELSDEDIYVIKTEVLLELARERRGAELVWEQWRAHIVMVNCHDTAFLWVSGPRLFCARCIDTGENAWVDVYDFSPRTSARKMGEVTYAYRGIVREMEGNVEWHDLPWHPDTMHFVNGGHDCIVFLEVNILAPKNRPISD